MGTGQRPPNPEVNGGARLQCRLGSYDPCNHIHLRSSLYVAWDLSVVRTLVLISCRFCKDLEVCNKTLILYMFPCKFHVGNLAGPLDFGFEVYSKISP